MPEIWNQLTASVPRLTVSAVVDIVLVAVLIYQLLMIVRGRRAAQVLTGILLLAAVYGLAIGLDLELLQTVLENLVPYTAFGLIVMFQSELRRFLARLGRRRWLGFGSRLETQEVARDICLAVDRLAAERTGALIVIEREIGLRTFVESGTPLDSHLTHELLLTIFHKGVPLHDGAVIVQGSRIAAAACFLPITTNPELSRKMGTRHRAAIGITEESDCIAIVVSEESGRVSVTRSGEIEPDVSQDRLAEILGLARSPVQPRRDESGTGIVAVAGGVTSASASAAARKPR